MKWPSSIRDALPNLQAQIVIRPLDSTVIYQMRHQQDQIEPEIADS
jgi:hypothetical protein